MQKRLWYGITWPSAILTLIFGIWIGILYGSLPAWLLVKLFFVLGLFIYHLSLHSIFNQQQKENFRWSSQQLRTWNEVATLFLISIVMLAVVKQLLSVVWGIAVRLLSQLLHVLYWQLKCIRNTGKIRRANCFLKKIRKPINGTIIHKALSLCAFFKSCRKMRNRRITQ